MVLPNGLRDRVLTQLRVECPVAPDLEGLSRLYAAWCEAVPFDNFLKLIHVGEGRSGTPPGWTAEDFFASWLELGVGGTCWAGNGALHALVTSLGFSAERAIATMMVSPSQRHPNHGSVVVALPSGRYILDASMLTRRPLRIEDESKKPEGDVPAALDPLPRVEWREGSLSVIWRTPHFPDGFVCRVDRIGVDSEEWNAHHQRTTRWSPFNFAAYARLNQGTKILGFATGQRFSFDERGQFTAEPRDRAARTRFLIEELHIAASLAESLPEDRPLSPPPEGFFADVS